MNKREIQEIKKQFTPENCAITRIAGCYVDGEKEKKMEDEQAFLSLPEEEMFKYFDIFRKTLSGNIGKTLLNMQYAVDVERNGDPEGYEHELLMGLRESRLKDPALLDEFYEQVMTSYVYPGNYYIILIHGTYDIPGKSTDGKTMEDASDEVYDFILCSICPVKLSQAGLSYNSKEEKMQERMRDWVVDKPDKGFLFPAFNDRSTDVHEILYYTKKSSDIQEEFINSVLGTRMIASADEQKEMFNGSIEDELATETLTYDGENAIYYMSDACYGYTVSIEDGKSGQSAKVVSSGAYYVEIAVSGVAIGETVNITVKGYKYNVSTAYTVQTVNNRGTDKEWQNPIISDAEHSKQVATWLADYFSSGIEYELDYRGEPAIDCGDTIGQENKYDSNLKAVVEEAQITFDSGLLGGGLVTRRKNRVARTKN